MLTGPCVVNSDIFCTKARVVSGVVANKWDVLGNWKLEIFSFKSILEIQERLINFNL